MYLDLQYNYNQHQYCAVWFTLMSQVKAFIQKNGSFIECIIEWV